MSRVRNFSEIAPNIAFPEFNFYELYYSTFEKSELGRIKKLLPLLEMAENFGLVRKSMRPKLLDFLTMKHATNVKFLWGNCSLVMKNRQKNRPKRPEKDMKLKF